VSRRRRNPIDKRPTHTALVLEALVRWPQEFASARDMVAATGSNFNQVSAALHHLRKRHAVDVVVELDGTGWWFATPSNDDRTHVVLERIPEDRPRKPRRGRPPKRVNN